MSNTKIFFTSDTHAFHKNIVRGVSEWEGKKGCRDFNTVEEMNEAVIRGINNTVGENDELYHLGDWSFGGIQNIWEFRKRINCKNIHLIFGNHDTHIENNKQILIQKEDLSIYNKLVNYTFSSPSLTTEGNYWVYSQSLFKSVQHYKELKLKKTPMIILCHYAMRVFNNSHKGSIMLYGHSHGTLDQLKPEFTDPTWIGDNYYIKNFKTMDVGVDTNNYKPYSLEEILDIMSTKDILMNVDHHNSETN